MLIKRSTKFEDILTFVGTKIDNDIGLSKNLQLYDGLTGILRDGGVQMT